MCSLDLFDLICFYADTVKLVDIEQKQQKLKNRE